MRASHWLAVAVVSLVAISPSNPAQAQVAFDWVVVGDPGNPCESGTHGCLGSVPYAYGIADTEVTNAQYAAFLNAVAATDSFGLYNSEMTDDETHGGIERTGTVVYGYNAKAGLESRPVNYVSYWDALRFANWLHNGQPTGGQGAGTTEDGAYTLTSAGISANSIVRNAGALFAVTGEDEWYKAAYYDFAGGFYLYPTASDDAPECTLATTDPETANCGFVGTSTDVGSYPGAASPRGTFDQGGNVQEWTGGIVGSNRTLRGGSYFSGSSQLASTVRWAVPPESEVSALGFRIAYLDAAPAPVPALGILATGVLLVLLMVVGLRNFSPARRYPA